MRSTIGRCNRPGHQHTSSTRRLQPPSCIKQASARRSDHGIRLIPYFGTLSGTTLALLLLGQLGKVLRITRERREFTEDNRARYWMLSIREAWLRILALDREGA